MRLTLSKIKITDDLYKVGNVFYLFTYLYIVVAGYFVIYKTNEQNLTRHRRYQRNCRNQQWIIHDDIQERNFSMIEENIKNFNFHAPKKYQISKYTTFKSKSHLMAILDKKFYIDVISSLKE